MTDLIHRALTAIRKPIACDPAKFITRDKLGPCAPIVTPSQESPVGQTATIDENWYATLGIIEPIQKAEDRN